MNKYFYLLFLVLITAFACNNAKPKAIVDNTKEDSLGIGDSLIYDSMPPGSVKADEYFESPFDTLIGCWAAIRADNITITFSKDSTFEFYDYNDKTKEKELLTGKFELSSSTLTLFYSDRPKQRFAFKKDPDANDEYRITNVSGYYFVKSHC